MLPDPVITDELVTRRTLESVLRTVLQDVVSNDTLVRMINTTVDTRMENVRTLVSGIDKDQHNSFQDFKDASRSFQQTAEKLELAMTGISQRVTRTETERESDARRISDLNKKVEAQDVELENLREKLENLTTKTEQIHIDIHGSMTETNRKSVFTAIEGLGQNINSKFAEVATRLDSMETKLDIHDAFIVRRKAVEAFLMKWALGMWSNKVYRYAVYTFGFSVLGIIGLNTPPGIDFLTRLVHAVIGK